MVRFLWRLLAKFIGIHVHVWSTWADVFVFASRRFERRRCTICGLTQEREIGWASTKERAEFYK